MGRILSDLLSGKMNIRKWVLWGFAVAFLVELLIAAGAVTNYVYHHPEAVLGVTHGHHD